MPHNFSLEFSVKCHSTCKVVREIRAYGHMCNVN